VRGVDDQIGRLYHWFEQVAFQLDRLAQSAAFTRQWIDWSAYVAPVAKLNAVLDIPPPPSGWPSTVTPPTTPAPTRIEPLALQDRIVPRLGLEWHALGEKNAKGFLRAGYEIARSPIAAQTGLTNYVDRDRHSVSLGVGGSFRELLPELPGTLTLDAHVQLSVLVRETTEKASAADYVGDYTAGGTIMNVGATAGFAFDGKGK
jgi:long-chain fatty acid transport protein